MTRFIRMPRTSFREIATGATGPSGLAVLRASNCSRQYLLLRTVADRLPHTGPAAQALGLLSTVQKSSRPAFDEVITYPHVGAALVRCLHDLPVERSSGILATIAAVAAHRAGVDFALEFNRDPAATSPWVHLPSMGSALVTTQESRIVVRRHAGSLRVGGTVVPDDIRTIGSGWRGLRWLLAPDENHGAVTFDDLNPDRGAGSLSPTDRLTPERFTRWKTSYEAAWNRLRTGHPSWAEQIRAVARVITPLGLRRDAQSRSASTWQSYGAVALTEPANDRSLAATLVHEVQHSKLNSLMTMVDLFDPSDPTLHYSPWRADPRPLRGILHGCYAFLGVSAFWAMEHLAGATDERAEYEFARAVLQVRQALATLDDARSLTDDGREFIAFMREGAVLLETPPVADRIGYLAELAVDDHLISWRLRTVQAPGDEVNALALAWNAGRPPPPFLQRPAALSATQETFVPNPRIRLLGRLAGAPEHGNNDADHLLARRDAKAALRRFTDAVQKDPENVTAWSGLALAAVRADAPGAHIWSSRPEWVRALHQELSRPGGEPPDPLILADWLATG